MLYSALAFLAGISVFLNIMPTGGWLAAAPLAVLLLAPWRWLRIVGVAAAGFLWCGWRLEPVLAQDLPPALENRDLQVEGVVRGLPERLADGRLRFRFGVSAWRDATGWRALPLETRLSWYRKAPELVPGERWRLRVRLKRPHGFANPGGFDYERWLLAAAIRATGYVREKGDNHRLARAAPGGLQALRGRVARDITRLQGDTPASALLRALGVGDRSRMSPAQWDVLRTTGTSHLMAISGLHVGLVAGLAFMLVRRLWSWSGWCEAWPARHAAALASLAAALAYALLSGFQVPAQRALIMVGVFMLAGFSAQRPSPWRVWSLALLLVLALDPLSALTPGLWLSFGAVAALLYLGVGYHGATPGWRNALRLQLWLPLALLPPGWIWFQQVSLAAAPANLLAIPWTGFLVVPPLLAGLASLPAWPAAAGAMFSLAAFSVQALWRLLESFSGMPGSLVYLPAISAAGLWLATAGLLCLLAPRVLPVRLAGGALLLSVLLQAPPRPARGDVWLTVLDVGQGLSAVIQTRERLLVFDAGPVFRSGFSTGEAVVSPYLRWLGYRRIDRLILSHADSDHAGGAKALRAHFPVGSVYSGEPAALDMADVHACRGGQGWAWDAVRFEILSPDDARASGNNASCVLRVTARDGRSILAPGDIERRVEQRLRQRVPDKLSASVLLAPHHGSLTSSSPGFVGAVSPQLVIFSTGYRNRFGFPKPAVSERYRLAGATALDTAQTGAVRVRIESGRPLAIQRYRDQPRFGRLRGRISAH